MKRERSNLHRSSGIWPWRRAGRLLAMAAIAAATPFIASAQSSSSNTVVYSGLTNTSLGGATLIPSGVGNKLIVSGIGSTGNDGVEVTLGAAAGFDATTEAIDLSGANAGVSLNAVGTLSVGGASVDLGSASFVNIGGGTLQILTNFSSINSTNTRVEVNSAGVLVLSQVVPTGVIGTVPTAAKVTGCGKVTIRPPVRTTCYRLNIDPPQTFKIGSSQTPAFGDEINLLADNPTAGGIDHISTFRIKAANVGGSFTVTAESVVNPTQGVDEERSAGAARVAAVPNVAGDATSIEYSVAKADHVLIEVYDALGRLVSTLDEGLREAGSYGAPYVTRNLTPGTYYLQLHTGEKSVASRMMVIH